MHNIKTIRDNPDYFKKKLADRNVEVNLENIIKKDKENRELIQKKENLEHEKKKISKSKEKSQFEKSKKISNEIRHKNEANNYSYCNTY